MNIKWKYAPKWASEVRRAANSRLVWVGYRENESTIATYVDSDLPVYAASVDDWPVVCTQGEDVQLTDNLLHVYTVGGHKLYAETPEAGALLKQLFADRANALADHFELGE